MSEPHHDLELAEAFAQLARALLAEPTLEATSAKIVWTAAGTIDGCESAGISLVEKGSIRSAATSGDLAKRVDAIQHETSEGPCLDAIREHEVFRTEDLASEARWPAFVSRAAEETGVRSMLAFRLFTQTHTMGALNLYSTKPSAFEVPDDMVVGGVLAAHAAVAITNAREVEGLKRALESRAVIERAKGIIMASTGCSEDEAFALLRQQSQNLNEKLRDVAAGIVDRRPRHG